MALIPTQTTREIGGVTFANLSDLIILQAPPDFGATQGNVTARRPNVGSGYTPSGSNNFRVWAVQIRGFNDAGDIQIGYSDNDVGFGSNTAFVNLVSPGGSSLMSYLATITASLVDRQLIPFTFIVPNGKFLAIYSANGNASVDIYGYEEA